MTKIEDHNWILEQNDFHNTLGKCDRIAGDGGGLAPRCSNLCHIYDVAILLHPSHPNIITW